ncbi:winged helix-turn-helix domain-containing protein [Colwellia psychrerythraea]|uniref:Transcriptional regulator, CadC n=1 Tax=Colwellia psychrerythraea TaxID=28229 RepID=A0A099KM15_COLPS|nr:winged helix-turn-helix domain-containing protein [Colwellia psychrerythraea]KGJ90638.1 transcriptional regulator, CadC [Colwellia psychrerythraea]
MEELAEGSFKLGAFLVQPEHNKLTTNEGEFKIESKIMQVLCYLVKHKNQVVSRSQIAEALWPGSVTGLEVVTRAIYELRKTLKDDAKKPIYIETIARKGYCFIYDFPPLSTAKTNNLFSQIKLTFKAKAKIFLAINMAILLLLLLNFLPSKSVEMKAVILTDLTSFSDMPAISPDEKQLLFVKSSHFKETYNQLILLDLASQKKREITLVNANYKSPVWLANSEYWYYIRCKKKLSCEVIKHNISNDKFESILSIEQQLVSFTISSDHTYLALAFLKKNNVELALVDLNKQSSQLQLFDDSITYSFKSHPVFSHDNKSVYYISTTRDEASQIYRYDLNSLTSTPLSSDYDRIRGLALKNENSLWVSGYKQETNGIWIFDLADNQSSIAFKAFPGSFPALISSQLNADKLIYTNVSRTIDLFAQGVSDLNNLTGVNSSMIDMSAVYSSNLKALYFVSNRNGLYDIWRFKSNTVDKVTNIKANMIERPILNLQQDKLAYLSRKNSKTMMTLFDLHKNVAMKQIKLPNKVLLLSWSNDQKNIYYERFEDGQNNVYKLDVETGDKQRILLNAGGIVQESEDGQSLYYGDRHNEQLMQKMISGEIRVLFKIPDKEQLLSPYGLKVIGNGFYFASQKENKHTINYYSFEEKSLSKYMDLPEGAFITDIVKDDVIGVIYDQYENDNSNLIELTR